MRYQLQTLTDYSDEALLSEIRRVAQKLGYENLSRSAYDHIGRVHSSTLGKRFGSWLNALEAAGISGAPGQGSIILDRAKVLDAIGSYSRTNAGSAPTIQHIAEQLGVHRDSITKRFGKWDGLLSELSLSPVPLGRRYTEQECLENILDLWTHYGRQPVFSELNHPPSRAGSKAYIRRWGGWRAALIAFVDYANSGRPDAHVEEDAITISEVNASKLEAAQPRTHSSRSISLSIRYKVLSRDRFRCTACGRSPASDPGVELHLDHIHPWSRGGDNSPENLRVLCFECNLGKGDRLFDT